jgi:hypothetical protein
MHDVVLTIDVFVTRCYFTDRSVAIMRDSRLPINHL